MAKINQVKLRQDADAAERGGRFDKAIESLKQIVQENQRDWNTINRIGDLYGKLNNVRAANEQYIKVARYFADDGFYLKSIAVWKKVLRNEPGLLDGHVSLGDLYAKQGLQAEAKQTFAFVYDEYVKRNKLREAGEVLRRMADTDPGDMKVRIRLAELYGREGDAEKAAGEYVAIADELVKKGLLAEALQLLEKALRGGQRTPRLLGAAARVYLVQKDFPRAIDLLQEARRQSPADRELALRLAEACLGARRPGDARAVLSGLLEHDPNDIEVRQQLGQVCLAEGHVDAAYDQLLPAVDRLVERRQHDRAAGLLQQIVQRNPSHIRSLAKLVELYRLTRSDALVAQTYSQMVEAYLAGGSFDEAATILELLVDLEPTNEQHRSKLRWLREQSGGQGGERFEEEFPPTPAPAPSTSAPPAPKPAKVGIVLSGPLNSEDQEYIGEHLAEGRVFRKYGLADKARDQFEAVLTRFPDNVEALRELADLHKDRGEIAVAVQRLRLLADVLRLMGDPARASRAEAEADALVPPPTAAPAAVVPAVTTAAPEPPIAARPPESTPLRPAVTSADLGLDIDVEDHEAPAMPAFAGAPALELEPAPSPEPEAELDFDLDDVTREPEPPPAPFDARDLEPQGGEIGGQFIEEEPSAAEMGFDLGETPFDAPQPAAEDPGPLSLPEDDGLGGVDLGDLTSLEESQPSAIDELPPPAAPSFAPAPVVPSSLVPQPTAAPARMAGVPAELQRALDEVESYVSMGFVDDARGVLEDLAPRFARHPALTQRLAELGLELPAAETGSAAQVEDLVLADIGSAAAPFDQPLAPADEPLQLGADFLEFTPTKPTPAPPPPFDEFGTAPAASAHEAGGFDLASELGGLFGAQAAVPAEPASVAGTDFGDASLADIFREFQKGVDKQLGKEDYETRYNLGIAYKEMGLVDEAIAEFQLAAKDEARLLECASMLGICFLEKGMPKLAVKWFEKGLQAPGRSDEEYQGLRYDLASGYEQAGEGDRALALFTELYGQDASFRDVAEKVRELSAGR